MAVSLATVQTRAPAGLDAPPVACEVQIAGGLPALSIVGLVETAVRESRERVKAAIRQSGYEFPDRRITVNLAPADLPKSGGWFDLAIALGILMASGQVPPTRAAGCEFFGELSFTGAVRPVAGLLPALVQARRAGRACVVPDAGRQQAGLLGGHAIMLAGHLVEVVDYLSGTASLDECPAVEWPDDPGPEHDLADVHGQPLGRRAVEIAAAGGHHLLMVGSPGTGKTMLARRLPGLLPPMTSDEIIATLLVRSLTPAAREPLCRQRPFRAPHHSASAVALIGGGRPPKPGEISLAHNGVLFLDELPEFNRVALEALREPLEAGAVSIARAEHTAVFPARFQLVAAMNPCPCGFAGDAETACRCTPGQVQRYRHRLSGPFLDRVDLQVELSRAGTFFADWFGDGERSGLPAESRNETSTEVAARAARARARQVRRAGVLNARLCPAKTLRFGRPDPEGCRLLAAAARRFALSARACDRSLKVARTIADLDESDQVLGRHVAEALSYRTG